MRWDEEVYRPRIRPRRLHDRRRVRLQFRRDGEQGPQHLQRQGAAREPRERNRRRLPASKRVVAHEYFHNWTGDRITCRDWFQLSLKEGLTVFRETGFVGDMRSHAVRRINDVKDLRLRQFQEDAGPLAHPVQPQSYLTIDNFYTATVYEKGAEVIGMLRTIVGQEMFRKGMDIYFERHDGDAATVEDFVRCFEDASGRKLDQFRLWYSQAGTPEVHLRGVYDSAAKTYALNLRQSVPPTPGQPEKKPMHIPLALGLIGKSSARRLPLTLEGENAPGPEDRVIELYAPSSASFSQASRKSLCSPSAAASLHRSSFAAPRTPRRAPS